MSTNRTSAAKAHRTRSISHRKPSHAGSIADRAERSPGGVPGALGRLAAVKMLKELLVEWPANLAIADEYRKKGTPQRDVVAEHLMRLPAEHYGVPVDAWVLGFTSMLTDVLSSCLHGHGVPNMKWLELLAMCPPDEARAAFGRRCRRRRGHEQRIRCQSRGRRLGG